MAVGYSTGAVRLWDVLKGTSNVTLSGHRGAVTAMRYNANGGLLATGSKDTNIVVWDVVEEAGLYRLNGHRDQVEFASRAG